MSRLGGINNIILFNIGYFGWIKVATAFSHGSENVDVSTNFRENAHPKITEGHGVRVYQVSGPSQLGPTLAEVFALDEPTFTDKRCCPRPRSSPPSLHGETQRRNAAYGTYGSAHPVRVKGFFEPATI
ncbi:MAG: hypothetical protein JSV27_08705 [Candidatus Bathyarchaeota archaeon]|nr:MAG: hypothetical protein JSV27_08705 [Candidatus Bathyarchaeota archaeon]